MERKISGIGICLGEHIDADGYHLYDVKMPEGFNQK